MPGMLPIDRVRKLSDQARERFHRARSRFTVKRAQVKDRARTYDDAQEPPPPPGDDTTPGQSPHSGGPQ